MEQRAYTRNWTKSTDLGSSSFCILSFCLFILFMGFSSAAAVAATGALSAAERSYPMSEVRGRSQKDPMPERRCPRGVIPCPRSGETAESSRLPWRRNGQEELPKSEVRGGGQEELPQD